jgi:undecaprenyl-diphosphatase
MESLEALNQKLFLAINADPATSAWLLGLGKFLAKDTLYLLPLLLVYLWFKGGDARRSLALKSVVVTIVSLGIGTLISLIYVHPRPFVLNLGHTYLQHSANASFPSHHATIFAAIGFCLLAAETRLIGWGVLAFGVAAGWARVYMGVHFPLDILGGFVVAYAGYFGVSIFWDKCWKKIHDKISKY